MIAIILSGGKGTRINSVFKKKKLKPLIKIKKKELLYRVIEIYKEAGIKNFYLLGGYKYNDLLNFKKKYKKINIKTFDTGLETETAGRLLKVKKYIKDYNFLFTYGDSLVDLDVKKSIKLKNKNNFVFSVYKKKIPYGIYDIKKNTIKDLKEKNFELNINSGFYVLDKRIFSYIKNSKESFEKTTLPKIIRSKKIKLNFIFSKKWYPMDTIEDKRIIENYLNS
jgi:glucose-1-phosphate cytidylyltransferase